MIRMEKANLDSVQPKRVSRKLSARRSNQRLDSLCPAVLGPPGAPGENAKSLDQRFRCLHFAQLCLNLH